MVEFWSVTWGDIATVAGAFASLGGLAWAIREAHGARTASAAAASAARETRDTIASHLQAVDLERAIGLIQRIKTLHDNNRWEGATEHYQTLRAMLSDVIVRTAGDDVELRERLATARTIIGDMENFVRSRVDAKMDEHDRSLFTQRLSEIQSDLEELASNLGFGHAQGASQ